MSHTNRKSGKAIAHGETDEASDLTKPTKKLTASEIEKGECLPSRLTAIGEEIEAKVSKADGYQTKAGDMVDSIKKLLAEAKEYCDEDGFNAFRKHYCPLLGKSRAYELLAIASGRKSVEEVKAGNSARQAKHIAKLKAAATSPLVTECAQPLALSDSVESHTEADGVGAHSIVPEQPPEPARPRSAVAQKDDAVSKFTDIVLELVRRTDKGKPERFAGTAVRVNDLAKLGQFLIEVANLKKSAVTKPPSMRAQGNDVDTDKSTNTMKATHQANEGKDAPALEADPKTDEATDAENTPEDDGRGQ